MKNIFATIIVSVVLVGCAFESSDIQSDQDELMKHPQEIHQNVSDQVVAPKLHEGHGCPKNDANPTFALHASWTDAEGHLYASTFDCFEGFGNLDLRTTKFHFPNSQQLLEWSEFATDVITFEHTVVFYYVDGEKFVVPPFTTFVFTKHVLGVTVPNFWVSSK